MKQINNTFSNCSGDAVADKCSGAKTGAVGDGKIFVLDMPECVRIRTGEQGSEAIS